MVNWSIKKMLGISIFALVLCTGLIGGINYKNENDIFLLQEKFDLWGNIDMMLNEDIHQPFLSLFGDIGRYMINNDNLDVNKIHDVFAKLKSKHVNKI